ncbi:MAG: hypothetical protein PUC41_01040 [Oscillospiraceae bacterium]|nr:hypothetical protein [Oscillospiraceae bacterium]
MTVDTRSVLLAILVMIFFLINYAILRDLIYGIFLGSKSKKTAAKIKSEQGFWAKLTMSYVGQHLKKYEQAYQNWQRVTLIHAILTVLSLIAFIVLPILGIEFWIVAIVCGVMTVYNAVLFMVMMSKTTSSDNKTNRKGSPWKYEQ